MIGNLLVDPCSMFKYTILVRPGSTGKSTFMNYMSDALEGCCDVLVPSVVYGSHDLDTATANKCCSQCMLVCNDVNFEQYDLNVQNYKLILGQDLLDTEPVKSKAICLMLIRCNRLPDTAKSPQ